MLLLGGGMMNGAWAATKTVTYHVITLPFGNNTGYYDGNGDFVNVKYRIEAIKKTVTQDDTEDVKIPAELKSPLMEYNAYSYYTEVTKSNLTKIFPDNPSTFYTYDFTDKTALASGAKVGDIGDATDIYVIYDWADTTKRTEYGNKLDLTGGKKYNIEFQSSTGTGSWLYALNMNSERGNRGQAVPAAYLNNLEDLCSDGPVTINKAVNGKTIFYFQWKLINNDPYNIILQTAYQGDFIYKENDYWKSPVGAQFFGSLEGSNKIKTNWLTSEVNKAWTSKSDTISKTKHGWFRGPTGEGGVNTNGVSSNLYFSFTLLAHPTASYTLAASWADVNGNDWVPNANGQYLLMQHEPEAAPYAGPKFLTLEAADQVRIHEIREYTYQVKTPFYPTNPDATDEEKNAHTVSATFKISDYEASTALTDHIPDAMKRKYTSIDGAYKENTFATKLTTLQSAIDNVTPVDDKIPVWLKYSVSSSLPFEAGTTSTTFANLKWYNIYVNKENTYITWYDDTNFQTKAGHSKYTHDSHFAFIGDPYELYVVSRKAGEDHSDTPYYLKLASPSYTDPLVASATMEEGDIWEMIYDDNTGDYADCFRLRKYKSTADPVYMNWSYGVNNYPLKGDGANAVRLTVLELPLMTYTYYVVDKNNRIAVMATEEQMTGSLLSYASIPEVIRSPFLYGGTLTFRTYASDAMAPLGEGMTVDFSSGFTTITSTNSEEANKYKNHIFVSYTTLPALVQYPLDNSEANSSYNVLLNNEYIYYDTDEPDLLKKIKSKATLGDTPANPENLWMLGGQDPYAMTIRNKGAGTYLKVEDWTVGTFSWVSTPAEASRFTIKSSTSENMYEVMATTSVAKDSSDKIDVAHSVDASTTYYNIGRADAVTVKMYGNATYAHGYAQIRFQLKKSTAKEVTYHLIDISQKELLTEKARHVVGEKPVIPPEIFSPLVGYENYSYWKNASTDGSGIVTCTDPYGTSDPFEESVPDDVYITYTANDLVDMNHTTMYLLKFEQGDEFRQEDGSDGLLPAVTPAEIAEMSEEEKAAYYKEYKAVYPYCNGDGNFFVYGQKQYELQQEGAASTRTRWAWYVESGNNDPYHVKILSRQTETYDGLERSAYFSTRTFSDYDDGETVVTALVWPNISGVQSTEYMVLGSEGQYQLVTTYPIAIDKNKDGDTNDDGENERYVVDSFEQYWKTYDTVKKKLLSDLLELCEEKERTDRTDGSIEVPTIPTSLRERLTGTGEGQYGFHSYSKMANAKRWNGYNASGEKKKGWETQEHWFQTVNMGSGYFDLIPTTIDPALILLDQHGWEIMRKPLPSGPDDPNKAHKYEVLGAYDSPMVKEYIFWASAKKRSGLHQYYLMDKRIGGSDFSSTSLTSLPPWGSENVLDAKGNHYDHYVTYIVKEEYAESYNPSTKVGAEFLISQGEDIAKKGETDDKLHVGENPGSTSQYIIDHIATLNDELWYVKPNADIDTEMGYTSSNHNWGDTNPNAYDSGSPYYNLSVAQIITNADDITTYGRFSFSNGFDPYNIQISSKNGAKYFTAGMTSAEVSEGAMVGQYGSKTIALADKAVTTVTGYGYDNSKWAMTNQTFMAVQDADGNMQLMPRFDHNLRMRDFGTLVTPTAEYADPNKLKETITYLYRPFVYNYLIIDNEGRESLRYQSGGDLIPQTPDHFKSPLAKDFKYYKNLSSSAEIYTEVANGTDISSKEITTSLAGAGLTTPSVTNSNNVYVRYAYDEDADVQHILQGKWLTMQLNTKDTKYDSGIKEGSSKPSPVDGNTNKDWQWKFLKNPYLTPDPYAVQLFNRDQRDLPMGTSVLDGSAVVTANATPYQRFALLSHTSNGYALAVAGTQALDYYFLQGVGINETGVMSESNAASVRQEAGFNGSIGNFDGVKSQILLTDDVENTYTYKIYTNDGVMAISDTQTQYEAVDNGFIPKLPDAIKTPLLNDDQFIYYESQADFGNSTKELTNLYGLYEGDVYVRYQAYDPSVSEYKVPNERNEHGDDSDHKDPVAKGSGSNDAPLRLDNTLPHNIIWYDDNMMKADGSSISSDADKALQNAAAYSWTFAGDDPYAIKIRHKNSDKYVHKASDTTCDLNDAPTTFMLLSKDGYEYGVLATTGNKDVMLSGWGNTLVTDDHDPATTADNPTKFIIFSLGTLKVIYHLVLANIGNHEAIPHRDRVGEDYHATGDGCWNSADGYFSDAWSSTEPIDTIWIHGTTLRDLSSSTYQLGDAGGVSYPQWDGNTATTYYCKDVGPISLGDALAVPDDFYRPNVNYFFIIRDIRDDVSTPNATLNEKYKGLEITSKEMSMNEDLIGKIIYIDIVYSFNNDLESNSGDNFVMGIDQNKWYTLETVIGGKTYLAQYTNAWGFELKEGRGSHYTNDFLWTPIGDPYGFQLMNRYMDVNSGDHNLGEKNRAIFSRNFLNTASGDIHAGGQQILMGDFENDGKLVVVGGGAPIMNYPHTTVATNSIYELLESSTLGYFRFHPVANTKEQTQVYFNPEWADDNGDGTNEYLIRLKTTAAEFTFGLSAELLKPYFDRAGYVGGLKKSVYEAAKNAALVAEMKKDEPNLTSTQLMAAQDLVYNSENIVQFVTGYYRLHSPLGISGIDPARYASGYTHAIERDLNLDDNEADAIPMHFYEKNSSEVRQFTDFKEGGFTSTNATRGDITISPVEKDPASIFYFQKVSRDEDFPATSEVPIVDRPRYNLAYVSTQGLYVRGTGVKGVGEAVGERAKAVMTANAQPTDAQHPTSTSPMPLFVMDLGGGVLLIHDNHTANGRSVLKYLSYDYSNDTPDNSTIYDLKLTNHTHTDHAKWCMQPVQDTETKGINEMALKIDLKQDKGNGYYYASFCAPYDVLLTDAAHDTAYICKVWNTDLIHLKKIGKYNTGDYEGNNQFVPAGTPVIIRSNKSSVTMALPTKTPSAFIDVNIFQGKYLEQLLPSTGALDVYTFGYPMTAKDTKTDSSTGVITFDQQQKAESGMGFYINATPNRESAADMGSWIRNNRYVYGNKIYYRTGGGGASAPQHTRSNVDFIPVVFDDDDDEENENPEGNESGSQMRYDNRIYDLQGRCVATEQQVKDGSWRNRLAAGVYILNGRKIRKK